MDDIYREAYDSIRSEERNADRERAHQKQEAQDDGETVMSLMQKIQQDAQELKRLVEDESYNKFFWDEKHAL